MVASTPARDSATTLVIIPTYNEKDNLPLILERVQAATPAVTVLIVDDNSPDGTGELADELAAASAERSADGQPTVHVMHRSEKNGLGGAYIAGFKWGLERDYAILCEMDADGSHAPEQLHLLLDRLDAGADVVLGSRYVRGSKVVNWPISRYILSMGGNVYARLMLGARINDITGGYRAYKAEVLRTIDLDAIDSAGYVFQVDLAWRSIQAGFEVVEVPITFTEREIGESKMSGGIVTEAFKNVGGWGLAHRKQQVTDTVDAVSPFVKKAIEDTKPKVESLLNSLRRK